ncbi:hypothetical protein L1987_15624 [Smallanthus sonchifolius]|uniref:Uncharacterized protein n=1 Tax=Smallanthus sonchifolius TaxID=185202 RepID=A0ACB9J6L1_9ASTR|nr:hypothetical protein L1987_15624 [Smallanthus sonchifolius]
MSINRGDSKKLVAHFSLTPTCSLKIQKGDITRWFIDGYSDAIVNPADERMLGGVGADGAIHGAAGPQLRTTCYAVPEVRPGVRCPTGEARITRGFKLPASYVIHTVGPKYAVHSNSAASLSNAYRNSLRVARENNIQYVAFPAISCGVFGYPYDEAATVAISTIKEHCYAIKEVHFVLFADDICNVWLKKAGEFAGKRVDFNMSPTCSLTIQKGDITRWFIDGSYDAIPPSFLGDLKFGLSKKARQQCYSVISLEVSRSLHGKCPSVEKLCRLKEETNGLVMEHSRSHYMVD